MFATVTLTTIMAACSTIVAGQPVSVFADPFKVAGMRAVDGPTGLRPGGTAAFRERREEKQRGRTPF